MDNSAIVSLPHGFLSGGSWVRSAMLRELNGYDEQDFGQMDSSMLPAARTTELLDRVATFGEIAGSKSNRELVRQLTVGDRVALMLQLRRLSFGDKIECIVTCPACNDEMSVGLSAGKLLQPVANGARTEIDVKVGDLLLQIRPVTGADLEALPATAKSMTLAEALVRSCIISSDRPLPSSISQETIAKVSDKLEEMDPQADIVLDLSCPACGHHFKTPFFVEDFMLAEIRARMRQLEREVHWIAFNYHWSEDDILSLPMRKRSRYVDLINRTLSGEAI